MGDEIDQHVHIGIPSATGHKSGAMEAQAEAELDRGCQHPIRQGDDAEPRYELVAQCIVQCAGNVLKHLVEGPEAQVKASSRRGEARR